MSMILIFNASNMAFSPKFDKDEKIFLNWSKSFEIFSETSIEISSLSFEIFSFAVSLLFIDWETAVSQSINNSDTANENISNESEDISIEVSENISKDFDQFKNIFSSLSNLGEKAIFEALKIKIIDIAYELAGYQIDKMHLIYLVTC